VEAVEGCEGGRKLWRRSKSLEVRGSGRGQKVWSMSKAPEAAQYEALETKKVKD